MHVERDCRTEAFRIQACLWIHNLQGWPFIFVDDGLVAFTRKADRDLDTNQDNLVSHHLLLKLRRLRVTPYLAAQCKFYDDRSIHRSIDRPIDRYLYRSIHQSIDQSEVEEEEEEEEGEV